MADTQMLATTRPARFVPAAAAIELIGRWPATLRVRELVRRAAATEGGVLLVAEPGVDVESVARELHLRWHDATAPFVMIDGGGADAVQLDRALFGVAPANAPRDLEPIAVGSRLAASRGGTLYLHGVADLPAAAQMRLARIVRDGEVWLDGDVVAFDVRLVASALPSIDDDVHEHRFRPDLYRRLAATRIDLPSLRERADDVAAVAERLLLEVCVAIAAPPKTFTQAALALLSALNWPGNVAELRNVIERTVNGTSERVIQIEQVVPALHLNRAATPFVPAGKLRDARLRFEREYIAAVLQHHGWRMADAAQTLGIQRPNLYRKARQLGIPVTRLTD